MGDSIFVVLPKGAKLTERIEVLLAPEEFGLKTANTKHMPEINKMLKKLELKIYNGNQTQIGTGKYSNAYARDGKICAVYQLNGENHAT